MKNSTQKIILLAALLFTSLFASAKYTYESYFIYGNQNAKYFRGEKSVTVDHITPYGFELYGPKGLGSYLQKMNFRFVALPKANQNISRGAKYPSPEEVNQRILFAVQKFPQIAKSFSIGKSTKGKDLLVTKISQNVNVDDNRPEFKFIANMHGDEIIGRELMVLLIEDLLTNYGKDAFITDLVNKTQIYILASMNPDGAEAVQRGNAKWIDLNRDFPDFSTDDNKNTPDGRAVETQAIMRWQAQRKFKLSANFHGGAEVLSYPWDTVPDKFPLYDLVKSISIEYASNAPYIGASKAFKQGITNGYEWYEVNGGMQDWSWQWHKDLQVTIELSNQKYPDPSTVPYYYQQNRKALLGYIARVHTVNQLRYTPISRR